MINYLKIKILSTLLHHANRNCKRKEFYALKQKLVKEYGRFKGYDLQYIPGKKCYSCSGKGRFRKYHYYYRYHYYETCWNCGGDGWYKIRRLVLLARYEFGEYEFHQPVKDFTSWTALAAMYRLLHEIDLTAPEPQITIFSYIEHKHSNWGDLCFVLLFWLFGIRIEKGFDFGMGWACRWYLPRNWIHNLAHLYFYRFRSIPVRDLIDKFNHRKSQTNGENADLTNFDGQEDNISF